MLGVANYALWAAGCTWLKPTAEPVSRWEFDEISSAAGIFEDRGPAHVLMILSGIWADLTTASLVEGAGGTSAYTDGSAYATIPADVAAHDLAALTISFYYQRASAAGKQILLAAGESGVHQAGDFSTEVLASGRLRAWHVGQDGVLRFFESSDGVTGTNLQVGTAHRIDLSLGPQGARIYLDGAELAAAAIPENTNGWNNARVKYLGRWTDGVQGPAVGVFDRLRIWNRQLTSDEIDDLEAAQSITLPQPEPGPGISIPEFEYQTITDSVPADALWWDPSNGDDSNNGSAKALAKKSFGAAQSALGAGGTIVIAGGAHVVPELVFTKSGTSGNRLKLFAEPGAEVVLYRDADFRGALERTWTWTLVDAGLGIWQSPNLGIPDGETIVNTSGIRGAVSNGLWGFMRCPNGTWGRPHLMRMMWYDLDGTHEPNAFHNPNTGANADERIRGGGWGGPGFYLPGDGRVQVRMQKASAAYQGTNWPADGRMGTLIDSNGVWQEPITEDPNDYEFHIVRFNGDFGDDGPVLFNMNGQSWWHVKGINGALINKLLFVPDGSENNWFEKCTWYPQGMGIEFRGTSRNNKFTRCMFMSGDWRSLSWQEGKGANEYWFQHSRNVAMFSRGVNVNTGAGTIYEHCTFFGWFDMTLMPSDTNSHIQLNHCAVLNTVDDGFAQRDSSGPLVYDAYRCFFGGGPPWSCESNKGLCANDWYWRFCVIDGRIPMFHACLGHSVSRRGVAPNKPYAAHSAGSTGPVRCMKMWNCTIIWMPDTPSQTMNITTGPGGHDLPPGRAHEVYNCIVAIMDNKRYPLVPATPGDNVVFRYSCDRSAAGTHRYDHNCYHRDVPNPVDPFCYQIQTSRNTDLENFTSLADFRSSGKKTLSESMYVSSVGAFPGSDGADGHEEHGVQVDPGFVDRDNLDYRPTHASVKTGALDVSSSGWPGATDAHDWKGALDPDGDGTEVGPQNP